ncbi:hypothetical protein [Ferrimonas pelagia]|uniref:Uncharacterized protein n=1 Tax=Ferrimonas pelagia TaxID=1177826 RepID=A0ABP9EV34_9GAMM
MFSALLTVISLLQPVPFEAGRQYACSAGPHQFEIQIDAQAVHHLSRYALTQGDQIAMPAIQYQRAKANSPLQWQILALNGQPSALFVLWPLQATLNVAILDQHGALLDTMEHPSDCFAR